MKVKRKWNVASGIVFAVALLAGQWYHTRLYTQTLSEQEVLAGREQGRQLDESVVPSEGSGGRGDASGSTEGNAGNGDRKKVAYLTFDDGPSALTEKYLDILEKHRAKATFFLIGQQIEGDMKEVVKREIREGHELGIHTYTHESGKIYQSCDSYYQDACKVKELLQEEFQYKPSAWRFPWGSANCYICNYKTDIIRRLQGEGLEYVDWNVSAEDSVGFPDSGTILANIRKDCFRVDAPVILMHDSGANQATLDTLESVITMLEEEGYGFGTISERKKTCHFGEYN